jgi:hypothetical protein
MRTLYSRVEIAKRLINAAANAERDPIELELAMAANPIEAAAA